MARRFAPSSKPCVRPGPKFRATSAFPAFEDILDPVVDEVGRADLLVFMVPEREGEGRNALMELGMARANGKPIVPVVLDATRVANSDVATSPSRIPYIDASRLEPGDIGRAIMAAAP